jgi:hypothetical protein
MSDAYFITESVIRAPFGTWMQVLARLAETSCWATDEAEIAFNALPLVIDGCKKYRLFTRDPIPHDTQIEIELSGKEWHAVVHALASLR